MPSQPVDDVVTATARSASASPAALPIVFPTRATLRASIGALRRAGRTIGLVPTMGALHAGHLSLVRAALAECDAAVVSIYVNPTQFGPREDFARYPRTLEADLALLADCGPRPSIAARAPLEREAAARGAHEVFVFAPLDSEVYRPGHATTVAVAGPALPFEGQHRPGHFQGVATIVLKLFEMVQPDRAYFGQKDYQQALVVGRMIEDLDLPLELRVCPIVREADGLAMSSRNRYLSAAGRKQATVLHRSLLAAAARVAAGEREVAAIEAAVRCVLAESELARVQYAAIVDAQTLAPLARLETEAVALLAVEIEGTRLIDNCLLRA